MSNPDLEPADVARWFNAEEDKKTLMRKWMEATKVTALCTDQQLAVRLWSTQCMVLREVHPDVSFVCEALDEHIKTMKEAGQKVAAVPSSTADQPGSGQGPLIVGGILVFWVLSS